jgi:hypothetical protein
MSTKTPNGLIDLTFPVKEAPGTRSSSFNGGISLLRTLRPTLGAEEAAGRVPASAFSLVSAAAGAASELSPEVSPDGDDEPSTATSVSTAAADKVLSLLAEDQLVL